MESIKINSRHIPSPQKKWEDTFSKMKHKLAYLPQIRTGVVDIQQAQSWLTAVSKLFARSTVERLIHQCAGIGAKDMRALIAHDRKEYYPDDSAVELYERKMLLSVQAPATPKAEEERILTNVARIILLEKYNLKRNIELERKMATPSTSNSRQWLVGRPGMVANQGSDTFLYDIQLTNKAKSLEQGDEIRSHYYDLVANDSGFQPTCLNVAKIYFAPALADSIVTLSKMSDQSSQAISELAKNFSSLPEDKVRVEVNQIERRKDLYEEIVASGKKHWEQICMCQFPATIEEPELALNAEKSKLYVAKGKAFVAAAQTVKVAEKHLAVTKSDFVESVRGFDISSNFIPPFTGALLRKYDNFDAEAAAVYLENKLSIDPGHLRKTEIDVTGLTQAFTRLGGDISDYKIHGAPDKKAIETVAEEAGVDLSGFICRKMRPIINPKTRGPIYDAIKSVRDDLTKNVTELIDKTAKSELLSKKTLNPNAAQVKLNNSVMK